MDNHSTDQPSEPGGDQQPAAKRRGRLVPPIWIWAPMLVCFALVALLRLRAPALDHANVNVGTLILTFIALMTLFSWFTLLSGHPFLVRILVLLSGVGMVVIAAAVLTIDHVSGELVPAFRLRWSAPADQLLPELSHGSVGEPVALLSRDDSNLDFPQFLGPQRNASVEGIDLARDWNAQPPKQLWKQPIGAGWSAFSVVNGFAVTIEQRGQQELVTCYEVQTGKLRWWHAVQARHQTVLGGVGPRSTPTIYQGKVFALGATGVLRCLDGADGSEVWPSKDLLELFDVPAGQDGREIAWGRSASPLIVDNLVVVPAGGPHNGPFVSLVAFDVDTGVQQWAQGNRQISYSSPALATIGGVRQILSVNESSVSGHDPTSGAVLWEHDWPGDSSANASTSQPVVVGDDCLFLSKGYGQGAALLTIERDAASAWQVSRHWHHPRVLRTKFTNVAVRDGYVYGLSDGILECVDLETGDRRWKAGRYGQGQILMVGDVLLVQTEFDGVAMVEVSSDGHHLLGRLATLEGQTWNNLCLFGRYLLVRNAEQAACYVLPLR